MSRRLLTIHACRKLGVRCYQFGYHILIWFNVLFFNVRRLYGDDHTTASELAEHSGSRDADGTAAAAGSDVTDSFNDKLNLSKASQSSSIVKRKVSR